jgi:enterochelin esterase-like enzyme
VVHENRYKSPELGDRHLMVYTPPGYDAAAAKTYPVMYLLHSATDNETYWFQIGRANFIMDNLIADGKAKPAIVVSCFGWPSNPPGPEEAPTETYYVNTIGKEMVEHVVPLIEKEYRAGKESKDRAILGFSGMGGCQALTIGLNHPGTFGYIAGLSCGFRANQNLDANFSGMNADIEKSRKAFNKVLVKVGDAEAGNVTPSQNVDRYLTSKQMPHTLVIVPGGIHSWVSWREYFRDFMGDIFKD